MFFWLSKVLWFIINPFNIILVLLVSGWLLLFKRQRAGRKLIGIGLIMIFLFGLSPLSNFMMGQLENRIRAGKYLKK